MPRIGRPVTASTTVPEIRGTPPKTGVIRGAASFVKRKISEPTYQQIDKRPATKTERPRYFSQGLLPGIAGINSAMQSFMTPSWQPVKVTKSKVSETLRVHPPLVGDKSQITKQLTFGLPVDENPGR